MEYEAIIGLEVHAQLSTKSKIFCACSTAFGAEPNTQICPVCTGMPGSLPVLNKEVVSFAVKLGLATHSKIRRESRFARKNYFYPDLPKGYQISQFEAPICEEGFIEVELDDGQARKIGLIRIQMEEDAGKSIHDETYVDSAESLIDLNRCGVPLLEIVSAPDIRSPKEAAAYLTKLRQMVRYLEICDGNMEEGSLRCDANISMRPVGQKQYGTRTELKNMNSISNVEKALQYEINRQRVLLENGESVQQETLAWDAAKGLAIPMRGKEESHDYRYFPEPDLVPVLIDSIWLDEIVHSMPEMAEDKKKRFIAQYSLSEYNADVLTASKDIADFFEDVAGKCADYRLVSNWIMGEVMRFLNDNKIPIGKFNVTAGQLAELLLLLKDDKINANTAKRVFKKMFETGKNAQQVIEELGLAQISDTAVIEKIIDSILQTHPDEVDSFKQGNSKVLGFLIGRVMRESHGKANPQIVNQMLIKKLKE